MSRRAHRDIEHGGPTDRVVERGGTLRPAAGSASTSPIAAIRFPRAAAHSPKQEIVRRYHDLLPDEMRDPSNPRLRVDQLVLEVGRKLRNDRPKDPHRMLASLPVTIYVTTNRDNLLEDALSDVNRKPEVVICRWRELDESQESEWPKSVFDREPDFQPSAERPLVFHVFGTMHYRDSFVLTEDDYFDFLVGVTRNQVNPNTGIPVGSCVGRSRPAGSMFLGFRRRRLGLPHPVPRHPEPGGRPMPVGRRVDTSPYRSTPRRAKHGRAPRRSQTTCRPLLPEQQHPSPSYWGSFEELRAGAG